MDIVQRLVSNKEDPDCTCELCVLHKDAANEITKLRNELTELRRLGESQSKTINKLEGMLFNERS